ncbi:response regulator transcription factor [Deltaproteobacteria bacterium TL4]
MAVRKLLVVEDEEDILAVLLYNLNKQGFDATGTTSGTEALALTRSLHPELIILDVMLPDLNGLEICQLLKEDPQTKHIPIVMLTAKGEESDIVKGLELGADDYITKPFSPKILLARIQAVLRRNMVPVPENPPIVVHDLTIHPDRHEVRIHNSPIELTFMEFGILQVLAQRKGRVVTRYQMVEAIRGDDYSVTDRSIDVHMVQLRKKIGDLSEYIETVRGIGYRLKE